MKQWLALHLTLGSEGQIPEGKNEMSPISVLFSPWRTFTDCDSEMWNPSRTQWSP